METAKASAVRSGRAPRGSSRPSPTVDSAGGDVELVDESSVQKYDAWFDRPRGGTLFRSELACLKRLFRGVRRPWLELGAGMDATITIDREGPEPSRTCLRSRYSVRRARMKTKCLWRVLIGSMSRKPTAFSIGASASAVLRPCPRPRINRTWSSGE